MALIFSSQCILGITRFDCFIPTYTTKKLSTILKKTRTLTHALSVCI